MKKFFYVISVLLLSLMFIGGASAFTYDNPAIVSDTGSLVPGDLVSATMTIDLPNGGETYSINLRTDLGEAEWSGGIYTPPNPEMAKDIGGYGSNCVIPEFELNYGPKKAIKISITVTGKVPDSRAGKDIYIMSITQTPAPVGTTEVAEYNTGKQHVYNPKDFEKEASAIENEISKLRSQLPIYQNHSIKVTAAESNLDKASGEITNARSSYSRSDDSGAFDHLEKAQDLIKQSKISIASYAIPIIKSKYDSVSEIANTLVEKGKTSEAAILKNDNSELKIEYDKLYSAFKTGGVPEVYDILIKSDDLKITADKYYQQTMNPLGGILGYWWILLIIAGVGVIVSVVVILIKRRNNWDELG